jgi:hypothetical protein
MFDPEFAARLDEQIERCCPSRTSESVAMLDEIGVASRAENRAAARQLVVIGALFGVSVVAVFGE